jgi:hypothetical protein
MTQCRACKMREATVFTSVTTMTKAVRFFAECAICYEAFPASDMYEKVYDTELEWLAAKLAKEL